MYKLALHVILWHAKQRGQAETMTDLLSSFSSPDLWKFLTALAERLPTILKEANEQARPSKHKTHKGRPGGVSFQQLHAGPAGSEEGWTQSHATRGKVYGAEIWRPGNKLEWIKPFANWHPVNQMTQLTSTPVQLHATCLALLPSRCQVKSFVTYHTWLTS